MLADKKVLGWYGIFVFWLVIFAAAPQLAAAQEQEVTYTLTGEALEGPETLEAGYHSFTLQNDGDKDAEVSSFSSTSPGLKKTFLKRCRRWIRRLWVRATRRWPFAPSSRGARSGAALPRTPERARV